MLRAAFILFFLPLYILLAGPPLLLYTLISRDPGPLYRGGVGGVTFFLRAAGVKVRIKGRERIPAGTCLFVANHSSSGGGAGGVGAVPMWRGFLFKKSLVKRSYNATPFTH